VLPKRSFLCKPTFRRSGGVLVVAGCVYVVCGWWGCDVL